MSAKHAGCEIRDAKTVRCIARVVPQEQVCAEMPDASVQTLPRAPRQAPRILNDHPPQYTRDPPHDRPIVERVENVKCEHAMWRLADR